MTLAGASPLSDAQVAGAPTHKACQINPNQRLAIFTDIDGTILAEAKHIAPSTIEAIRAARANGHLVFVSTGRAHYHIPDVVLDIGFDGIIGSGGGVAVLGDEVVVVNRFTPEEKRWLLDYFARNEIEWFGETTERLYASPGLAEAMQPFYARFPDVTPREYAPMHELGDDQLVKAVVMSDDVAKVNMALSELSGKYHTVSGTIPVPIGANAEFSPAGINKGSTIKELLQIIGIPQSQSIAIGDNWNDIEMFAAAGLAIAMGNAVPGVKEHADDVTTSVLDNGIYNALKKHNVI